jgi:cell division protein FtsN
LNEAKQFAEGFTVRGYNPIINEVKIDGKGTWYRVSLGLFNSVDEAKTYIKQEQSLFSGQEHVISEIQ